MDTLMSVLLSDLRGATRERDRLRAALVEAADYCAAQLRHYAQTADSSGEDDPLYHAALCFHYMQLEQRLRAALTAPEEARP